jgi:histidinol phosphatase-like enzyme (inositol monophosphatase family)
LQTALDFAVDVARGAGEIILSHYRTPSAPDRKADGTFVTQADRAAETYMRKRIAAQHPSDGIVGEEFGERLGSSGRRWVLDPIDGTFSFVHGVPLFGALIGLEAEGEAVVGVAHFPGLAESYAAARGLGCRRNGDLVHTSKVATLAGALIVTNEPFSAERLIRSAGQFRGWGDCYGYVLVASGRADVSLDPLVNIWDCAALAPIVEEAGGTFTDWSGTRSISSGNAVATNGPLFPEVIAALRGEQKTQ